LTKAVLSDVSGGLKNGWTAEAEAAERYGLFRSYQRNEYVALH
jgi:hypothetical protein